LEIIPSIQMQLFTKFQIAVKCFFLKSKEEKGKAFSFEGSLGD